MSPLERLPARRRIELGGIPLSRCKQIDAFASIAADRLALAEQAIANGRKGEVR